MEIPPKEKRHNPENPQYQIEKLEEIAVDELPEHIKVAARGILRNDKILNLYKIPHSSQEDVSYAIRVERSYESQDGQETQDIIFLYDSTGSIVTGVASATLYRDLKGDQEGYAVLNERPYVSTTETLDPDLRQLGLGTRRIQLLNELCKRVFGLPLHSSGNRADEATMVWKKLHRLNLVEAYSLLGDDKRMLGVESRFKFPS